MTHHLICVVKLHGNLNLWAQLERYSADQLVLIVLFRVIVVDCVV